MKHLETHTGKNLLEAVRAYPVGSKVYEEYCVLIGKAQILSQVELKLREIADGFSNSLVRRQAPELDIVQIIEDLRSKLYSLMGRPTDHRLGTE
jgi:hypothetical protein